MKVINNRNIAPFDVDETLIMHGLKIKHDSTTITVVDPLTNKPLYFTKNQNMIRLMQEEKAQGSHIVVWSRGGHEWAEAVVRALGLDSTVDLIMTKPMVYFDDKPVEEWLKYRVYLEPGVAYKNGGK